MESRKGQPLKILYSDFYSETVLDIVQDNNDAQFLNTSLLFDVFLICIYSKGPCSETNKVFRY